MVKYLLLLAVVLAVLWLLRQSRARSGPSTDAPPPQPPPHPTEIVECAQCGVHLPAAEALPGPAGRHYCCEAHRRGAGHG